MKILNLDASPFHEIRYLSSGRQGKPRNCILPFYRATVDTLPQDHTAIVLTSDLQGRERQKTNRLLGETVAEELAILQEINQIPPVSAVILAGDLYDYPDLRKLGGTGDTTSVWNAFAEKFPLILGVLGNHDQVDEQNLDPQVNLLDGTHCQLGDLAVFGISGIIGQPNRNQRKTAEEFFDTLVLGCQRQSDLIILHQGPDLPGRDRIGEPLIREVLEQTGAALVVFGHCHWEHPLAQIGKNQVVNVDARVIILMTTCD